MAWIEVHQTLPTHRKVKRLKRLLKIKTPQAVGHMVMLWLWAIDNAPDGKLDALDAEDIAEAAEWGGDPKRFLSALEGAGFIDRGDGLSIHDWGQFAGFLADKREVKKQQDRDRQKRYRDRVKSQKETVTEALPVTERNASVTRDGDVTQPLRNAPNLTLPNLTLPNGDVDVTCEDSKQRYDSVTPTPTSPAAKYYMAKISPTASPASMRELLDFERDMGTEVCLRAIDSALDANARSWNYVKTVLQTKREQGVKSPEDWDRLEAQRKDARHRQIAQSVSRPADLGDIDKLLEAAQAANAEVGNG